MMVVVGGGGGGGGGTVRVEGVGRVGTGGVTVVGTVPVDASVADLPVEKGSNDNDVPGIPFIRETR